MKRSLCLLSSVIAISYQLIAQTVGIGTLTPNTSAILDLTSTSKSLLIPRMTGAQRNAIPSAIAGMIVYQTNTETTPASSPGFYFHAGAEAGGGWRRIARADEVIAPSWTVSGNDQFSNVTGGVGIGTGNPNASALLELNSTTRGFLPLGMTTAQRISIALPAEGLMVFDNTEDRLYQYQNGEWKYLLNGDYYHWALAGSNLYCNPLHNIGIGTSTPLEKLHVSGNMRLTGDLINTGSIRINNAAAILRLQNAAVDKGFIQLSGDNLRLGTNSGNTTGNLVVRMNGTDRVFIDEVGRVGIGTDPTQRLDVAGNINFDGEITNSSVTGSAGLTAYAYGLITASETIHFSTGNFSIVRLGAGISRITCNGVNTSTSALIAMASGSNMKVSGVVSAANTIDVYTVNTSTGNLTDANFYFVVYKL